MSINLSAWGTQPPLWVRLLATEVARSNFTEAAKRIDMSRTSVSVALKNRYPSPTTAGIERRVMEKLGRGESWVICPAQEEQTITLVECQAFRERKAPTHNPYAMRCWKACQHCPHRHCSQEIVNEQPDQLNSIESTDPVAGRAATDLQSGRSHPAKNGHPLALPGADEKHPDHRAPSRSAAR